MPDIRRHGCGEIADAISVVAQAIASCIPEDELHEDVIIPSVYNRQVAEKVANEVERVAFASGLARKHPDDHSLCQLSCIQT